MTGAPKAYRVCKLTTEKGRDSSLLLALSGSFAGKAGRPPSAVVTLTTVKFGLILGKCVGK
jgi:hypothetical protein